ncbi:MAG: hypothetical protein V7637_6116 [Mycobacteriales bacterium]
MRAELRTLAPPVAERVARHLVATAQLLDEDPEAALAQARAARAFGARLGSVREAAGIAAYRAGEWAEAIAELRTARRLTGDASHLPLIADSERALGRPERALTLARSAEAIALPAPLRAEMRIVESGARRDLGQLDAGLVALEGPDLDRSVVRPWSARLRYAYADLLLALGREQAAREWFVAAAEVDADGTTDAAERLLVLDGFTLDVADDDLADDDLADDDLADDEDGYQDEDLDVGADDVAEAGLDDVEFEDAVEFDGGPLSTAAAAAGEDEVPGAPVDPSTEVSAVPTTGIAGVSGDEAAAEPPGPAVDAGTVPTTGIAGVSGDEAAAEPPGPAVDAGTAGAFHGGSGSAPGAATESAAYPPAADELAGLAKASATDEEPLDVAGDGAAEAAGPGTNETVEDETVEDMAELPREAPDGGPDDARHAGAPVDPSEGAAATGGRPFTAALVFSSPETAIPAGGIEVDQPVDAARPDGSTAAGSDPIGS